MSGTIILKCSVLGCTKDAVLYPVLSFTVPGVVIPDLHLKTMRVCEEHRYKYTIDDFINEKTWGKVIGTLVQSNAPLATKREYFSLRWERL